MNEWINYKFILRCLKCGKEFGSDSKTAKEICPKCTYSNRPNSIFKKHKGVQNDNKSS
jgi:rRNA maturation endonuclease Nob1